MLNSIIFFKDSTTGGAWWPIDSCDDCDISFDNGRQYRIHNRVYTVDTMVFRNAHYDAVCEETWDMLKKKDR